MKAPIGVKAFTINPEDFSSDGDIDGLDPDEGGPWCADIPVTSPMGAIDENNCLELPKLLQSKLSNKVVALLEIDN
jgi:hypothetical protein